jgi:flagellar motor switch protein FliM
VVVVTTFHVELEGGGGDLHVTMPYSMVEPIREILDAGVQSDRSDIDDRWAHALREDMKEAEVEVSGVLTDIKLPLKDVLNMKPGDVVQVDLPEKATVLVEDIPLFRGYYGVHEGMNAVKIAETIKAFS